MNRRLPIQLRGAMLAIVLGLAFSGRLGAQPTPPAIPRGEAAAEIKSPVESFRELLGMTEEIRQRILAKKSATSRQRILDKLHEYTALTAEQREARLRATELSWYLQPLITLPAANRVEQLARIPVAKRIPVQVRLQQWDALAAAQRATLLQDGKAIAYLTRIEPKLNTRIASETLRHSIKTKLNELVKLRQEEKVKVLRVFPEDEREQMQKTLQTFGQLAPSQRERCLEGFVKFTTMPESERQEFLNNANQWAQLPESERQLWRQLVSQAGQ